MLSLGLLEDVATNTGRIMELLEEDDGEEEEED